MQPICNDLLLFLNPVVFGAITPAQQTELSSVCKPLEEETDKLVPTLENFNQLISSSDEASYEICSERSSLQFLLETFDTTKCPKFKKMLDEVDKELTKWCLKYRILDFEDIPIRMFEMGHWWWFPRQLIEGRRKQDSTTSQKTEK